MKTLGWVGAILLAGCGLPEVLKAVETGECTLTWTFLLMWFFGEIFVLIPVVTQIKSKFLTFNYTANVLIILTLILYKI